ncbi:uncharacterized protein [Panulirus ornatus]|uniref:uncharacterized protein n=1 Tax=Panulirus ornatus TaxID=150431 RepID=UPI003A893582
MCFAKVLSRLEVKHLITKGVRLGEGAYGTAYLVKWDGAETVLKVAKDFADLQVYQREAYFLEQLGGAGGAPRLLATSVDPPAILISFVGQETLKRVLLERELPDEYLGLIGLQMCLRVKECHLLGICHKDLHTENIIVNIPDDLSLPPEVCLIDFGLAVYNESALAQLPGDDPYHGLSQTKGSKVTSFKIDVADLGYEICANMEAEAPQSVRLMAVDASLGTLTLDDLITGLKEFF